MKAPSLGSIPVPRSESPDCIWPAIPSVNASKMLAMQYQFAQSERWDAQILLEKQFEQIFQAYKHAVATVPYYRKQLDRAPIETPEKLRALWSSVPLLTRARIQDAGDDLLSKRVPQGHDRTHKVQTSGSTGALITAYGTDVTRFYWIALTLREHLWHARDFQTTLLSIRPESKVDANKAMRLKGWGPATDSVYQTGPSVVMKSSSNIETQAWVLAETSPDYLLSLPSNLLALADYCAADGIEISSLRQVRTFGEALNREVRERCRDVWNVPFIDVYSAQEVGYIAAQCSVHEDCHVQSESLFVEILDANDEPCAEGEIGRVVVTTLQNFAMPLLRYEIGDYAEVGPPSCDCGRSLPVLKKVLGRERNMLVLPDGRKLWPSFPAELRADRFHIRQLQLVQTNLSAIEARLITDRPLSGTEEQQFRDMLIKRFDYDFTVTFAYPATIARTAGGKYEDFVSRV